MEKEDAFMLYDSLKNMIGCFDNPIRRRQQSDFEKEACDTARQVMDYVLSKYDELRNR